MRKTILGLTIALFMTSSAIANKIYSEGYGQWELMAWSGQNQFCALKTKYRDGSTLSLRQTSMGLTLVVYNSRWQLSNIDQPTDVYFNGNYYGSFNGESPDDSPHQIFVHLGHDWEFLELFQASNSIHLKNNELGSWNAGLFGTRFLGNYLSECVNKFGF